MRDRDLGNLDAGEPASEPIVLRVVHYVEEGRRGDDELDRSAVDRGRRLRRAGAQHRWRMRGDRSVAQERGRFSQDQLLHVAVRGRLSSLLVDLALRLRGHRLIGRERVDGEETRRMTGQAVDRHHPDPIVDRVRSAGDRCPLDEPSAKRADVTQCAWAEESEEFAGPRAFPQPASPSRSRPACARPRRASAASAEGG